MSYRKKNMILVSSFIVLCFVAYQLAIKKTLELRSDYKNIRLNKSQEKAIQSKIRQLSAQKRYLDSLVSAKKITSTNLQNELLVTLNRLCDKHRSKIFKFYEPHIDSVGGIENTYHRFSIKGNYKQVINTIHDLEYDRNLGRLVSLKMEKQKDYKRNSVYLITDIIIKNTQ